MSFFLKSEKDGYVRRMTGAALATNEIKKMGGAEGPPAPLEEAPLLFF
jgi:hypothetical protein